MRDGWLMLRSKNDLHAHPVNIDAVDDVVLLGDGVLLRTHRLDEDQGPFVLEFPGLDNLTAIRAWLGLDDAPAAGLPSVTAPVLKRVFTALEWIRDFALAEAGDRSESDGRRWRAIAYEAIAALDELAGGRSDG